MNVKLIVALRNTAKEPNKNECITETDEKIWAEATKKPHYAAVYKRRLSAPVIPKSCSPDDRPQDRRRPQALSQYFPLSLNVSHVAPYVAQYA